MDKRIDLFSYYRNEGLLKNIKFFAAKETVVDPVEKNTIKTYMNPIPAKVLVRQSTTESLKWKFTGLQPAKSIEVIAERKYETLFKTADKIEYDGEFYSCWKDDSKNFMLTKRDGYVIAVLGLL